MYMPPNAKVKTWDHIKENLPQATISNSNHIFLLGDLNCDMLAPNNKLFKVLDSLHMTQIIKTATHLTKGKSTLLDIVATNSLDLITIHAVLPPSLSNHCAVTTTVNLKKQRSKPVKRKIYNYKEANWGTINQDLLEHNWNKLDQYQTVEESVSEFTKAYHSITSRHIPSKIVKVSNARKPWMTERLEKLAEKKRKAYKKPRKLTSQGTFANSIS